MLRGIGLNLGNYGIVLKLTPRVCTAMKELLVIFQVTNNYQKMKGGQRLFVVV